MAATDFDGSWMQFMVFFFNLTGIVSSFVIHMYIFFKSNSVLVFKILIFNAIFL